MRLTSLVCDRVRVANQLLVRVVPVTIFLFNGRSSHGDSDLMRASVWLIAGALGARRVPWAPERRYGRPVRVALGRRAPRADAHSPGGLSPRHGLRMVP